MSDVSFLASISKVLKIAAAQKVAL